MKQCPIMCMSFRKFAYFEVNLYIPCELKCCHLFYKSVFLFLFAFHHNIFSRWHIWGGWGYEVSCGGHHRLRGKTTTGSALDGAVFDIVQILAYLVQNISRSQFYLGFGHFGWLPSFIGQWHFGGLMVKLYFFCWNYFLSSGWHIMQLRALFQC